MGHLILLCQSVSHIDATMSVSQSDRWAAPSRSVREAGGWEEGDGVVTGQLVINV